MVVNLLMNILFHNNKSFEVTNGDEFLSFRETEELSYAIIEKLNQFRLADGAFSFSVPFDMIDVFFEYQQDGTVIIGSQMYDETERQELLLNASDFFLTLTNALHDYFKSIEAEISLENYIIDNNTERNKRRKWQWALYYQLDKNFNGRKVADLSIKKDKMLVAFFEQYKLVSSTEVDSLDAFQELIDAEDPMYLTIYTDSKMDESWHEFLYYYFAWNSKHNRVELIER
jgi:hypothetical protein